MTQFHSALSIDRWISENKLTLNLESGQTLLKRELSQDTAGIFPTLEASIRDWLSRDCNSIYRKPDRVDWKNSAFWQILRNETKLFDIMQSTRWESCSDFWLVNKNLGHFLGCVRECEENFPRFSQTARSSSFHATNMWRQFCFLCRIDCETSGM